MASSLAFDIIASDKSQRAFSSVSRSLTSLEGRFAAAQQKMGALGRSMRNFGAGLTAGVTAPLALLGRDALKLFDEQTRAMQKVETAVRSTGGAAGLTATELAGMASALQEITTFGDEQILDEVTATLLTFTKIAKTEFPLAQAAVLDMATLLETDLRSAAIQVGKALNDPIAGVTALGRAGVQFSAEQKSLIRSLVEVGDVAGAQAIILAELQTQFGGQAEAAARTALGPMKQLANSFGDLKEEIGAVLAEVLPPLIDGLRDAIKWFQGLSPETKRFAVVAGGLAAVVGPLVGVLGLLAIGLSAISAPALAVVAGIGAATAAFVAFRDEISSVFDWLGEAVTSVLGETIAGGIDNFATRVGDAFVALGQGLWAVVTGDIDGAWEHFRAAANDLAAAILEPTAQIAAAFSRMGAGAVAAITGMIDSIRAQIIDRLQPVLASVGDAVAFVERQFAWLYDKVVGNSWVPDMVDAVLAHMTRMNEGMVTEAGDAASRTSGEMSGLASTITGELKSALASGELSWRSFGQALLNIGQNIQSRLLDALFKPLEDQIANALSGLGKVGAAGGGGGGGFGGLISGAFSFIGGLLGFADGGVFANGGVVTSPTPFSFGGGKLGVMGEAGPEAILPLSKRGGKLGVRLDGDGGGDTYVLNIHGTPAESVQGFRQHEGEIFASWAERAEHFKRRNR